MIFSKFFKNPLQGIFVDDKIDGRNAFNNIRVDYVLSRSLYSSAPSEQDAYSSYALGNYAPKRYIDTLSSYISTPEISAVSDLFTQDIQDFIKKKRTDLLRIYRQTMIDGKHFIQVRIENNILGNPEIVLKQIPLELVREDLSIKNADGSYSKFVYETQEKWTEKRDEKKATIQFILEAGKEIIEITGDKPQGFSDKKIESKTIFEFVPVYCIQNNKLVFMKDGLPEIVPVVPFIKRYDATLRKLGKHIDNILDPKLKAKVKNPLAFMRFSFGLSDSDINKMEQGKSAIDITKFKAAMLTEATDDIGFITQQDNTQSAVTMLKLLHWIIIELTMPEYLYGTAMGTTNASVQEQSPVWIKKVEDRRGEWEAFYYWLTNIFYIAKTKQAGRDIYASDGGFEGISIDWEELSTKDDVRLMQALSTLVESLEKLMDMGLVSAQTAFNTLRTFIVIPNDYQTEKEAAAEWVRFKLELETIQDRIRSGEADIGDAINELFSRSEK